VREDVITPIPISQNNHYGETYIYLIRQVSKQELQLLLKDSNDISGVPATVLLKKRWGHDGFVVSVGTRLSNYYISRSLQG
jgi:hypothetical protein